MKIEDFIRMASDYEDSAEYVDYRDSQLRKGWVTIREVGDDSKFYGASVGGGIAVISQDTLELLEVDSRPDAWLRLEGMELERYTPFEIVALGSLPAGTGRSDKFSEIRSKVLSNLKAIAKEKRKSLPEGERPRPARVGPDSETWFASENGLQTRFFSGREYERWNESRRFFQKTYLPYAEGKDKKRTAYVMTVVSKADSERYGERLGEEVRRTTREALSLAEVGEYEELLGVESDAVHRL